MNYKGLISLLLLLAIVPVAAWRLALSDTVGAWFSIRKLSTQIERLQARDSLPGSMDRIEFVTGSELLQTMDCHVVRFTPYSTGSADGLSTHADEVILSGDFHALVGVIERIERELPSCRLLSVAFRMQKPRYRQQPELQTTLVIQQIIEEL